MALRTPIYLKSGDSLPVISHVFESSYNLTGATALFHLADWNMEPVLQNGAVSITGTSPNWVLAYAFQATSTDPLDGLYHGEFRITLSSGAVISEPNDGYLLIKIQGELGPASDTGTGPPTSVLASSATVLASSSTVLASSE